MAGSTSSLAELLLADGPAADRADKMGLYSWLIGAWEMDTTVFADDGQRLTGHGKIRFGWALEGRAIQDVWILPGLFYGTTLRIYDPGIDAWHIIWSDPVRQYFARQIGRAQGEDIVQLGKTDSGVALRWSFTEITPNSFRWLGERSFDEQATWHLQAEYLVRLDPLRGLSRAGSRWQEGRLLPAGCEAPAMELMSGDARWSATSMLFVTGDTRPPVFSLVLSGIAKGPGRRFSRPIVPSNCALRPGAQTRAGPH